MKMYQVSLCVSAIEAESKEDAIKQFDELVKEGTFDWASYEVEEEDEKEKES